MILCVKYKQFFFSRALLKAEYWPSTGKSPCKYIVKVKASATQIGTLRTMFCQMYCFFLQINLVRSSSGPFLQLLIKCFVNSR